jgi:hypothetical protein
MTTEQIIFTSVARRLEAGTYLPRITIPAVTTATTTTPMRDHAWSVLGSALLGGVIGYMLGGF